MAMSGAARPALSGFAPARGSIRLVLMRVSVVLASSLPALLSAWGGVAGGAARRPYYTEVEGRMPMIHLVRFFREVPSSYGPALAVGVALAILADQLVMGGALKLLDPARPDGEPVNVRQAVLRDGLSHLWAFLRAALLGLVLSGIGVALLRWPFKKLDVLGYQSGWTGLTTLLRLPLLSMGLAVVWIASVGAWVFWCRLITAADGRERVRKTGLLVLRVFARRPLRTWGLFVLLTIATTFASGAALFAWRQAEPKTGGGVLAWALLWLVTVFVQAAAWLWLLRSGRLLYASEALADVRARPDDPIGIFRWVGPLAKRARDVWPRRHAT